MCTMSPCARNYFVCAPAGAANRLCAAAAASPCRSGGAHWCNGSASTPAAAMGRPGVWSTAFSDVPADDDGDDDSLKCRVAENVTECRFQLNRSTWRAKLGRVFCGLLTGVERARVALWVDIFCCCLFL